jgi:hypothetical protein
MNETCTTLFKNLTANPATHEFFLSEDIFPPLMVLLDSPNPDNKKFVLNILTKMSESNNKVGKRLGEYEGISGLIAAVHHSNDSVALAGLHFLEIASKANENNKLWIGQTDCIPTLLELFKEKKETKLILSILQNLTEELDDKNELIENKKLVLESSKGFVDLLKETKDEETTSLLISILGNVSAGEFAKKVIESGATGPLMDLLVNETINKSVIDKSIATMSKFALNDDCVELLMNYKVIENLLGMLKGKVQLYIVVDMFTKLNNLRNLNH